MENIEVEKLVQFLDTIIDFKNAKLMDEYFYSGLPLCVIDSVYSIGVKYESTRNVVNRYCAYFNLPKIRKNRSSVPPLDEQESIKMFLTKQKNLGIDKFADDIFFNRQMTSSRSGIFKAEAVLKFTEVLHDFEVDYFQDVQKIIPDPNFDNSIRRIHGQGSGISLTYFFMLAGSDNLIKPDRMILNFLTETLGRKINQYDAQDLLSNTVDKLKSKYPDMTPRLLDHEIWKYQRSKT